MSVSDLSFLTPVVFEKDRTLGKCFLEKVDGYFSLSGKRAFVISGIKPDQSYDVVMKDYEDSIFSKLIFTILKVVTYITFVVPLFMFFLKVALRSNYTFNLVADSKDLSSSHKGKAIDEDIFIFGDIHGELDGFEENLREAGVVDFSGKWKTGNTSTALQMGDVPDRGPKSLEAYDRLDRLQEDARLNGGKVIRLIGNHELMILQKNYFYALASGLTEAECDTFRMQLIKDIKENKIQLAWTDGERMYTHAGIRTKLREILIREILAERQGFLRIGALFSNWFSGSEVTLADMETHINKILKKAVSRSDFSHPVFTVGRNRGGDGEIGGLLWEDESEMLRSAHARDIKQVFAHNPPRGDTVPPIRITDSMRLINVDAGLCKAYGNHNAFVQIHKSRVFVHEKIRSFSIWFFARSWRVREVVAAAH